MKKITRIVLLVLIVQIVFGSFIASASTNSSNSSTDISGHWAEATIKSWLEQGYINGYSDGSFRPNNNITRAEFVKIVNSVFKLKRVNGDLHYHDMPRTYWAYDEFTAAIYAGYIGGTSQNTLSPDKVITRQEAAVMLVKLTGIEGSASLHFKDASDIPSWSRNAIEALVAGGYMNGDTSGNFRARDGLTRAEAVVLIDKVSANSNLPKEMLEEQESIEQLQELPSLLSDVNTSSSINWTKKYTENTKAPIEGFDPNHYSYLAVLDKSLIGEHITISFQANQSLNLSINVIETDTLTNSTKESVLFAYDDPREDVQLKLEDKKDYIIYVNVVNPYSGAYQDYRFELFSHRDESEWFKISQLEVFSQLLQVGDQVEIKVPGEANTTGETYIFKHTVGNGEVEAIGSYVGDMHFSLVNYYDIERAERISFTPSSGIGNIDIKLIRNSAVLHQHSYEYDFSPLNQLYGVVVHQFNTAERLEYTKKNNVQADIVYEVDFSEISGAAYVSLHSELTFTTLHNAELKKAIPSVQDIANTTTYYELDDNKKLIRASYLHYPIIEKDIQTKFIVFDRDKKPLGYVVIVRELNEEYVSNRITLIKDLDDYKEFFEGQK